MNLREITEQHQYPAWLMRSPRWIFIHYALLKIFFLRSRICRRTIEKYILKSGSSQFRILDVGCGEGQYIVPLSRRHVEVEFTGIDRLSGHIDFLQLLQRKEGLTNCTFVPEDLESHISTRPWYSLVYMIGVIQYTEDPQGIIRKLNQNQKPGDHLIIYTPVSGGIEFGFYQFVRKRYGHYDDFRTRYNPIDPSGLQEWIDRSGYRIIRQTPHYGYAGSLGHQIMQSLLILISYWPGLLKVLPLVTFVLLSPIIVLLQLMDAWVLRQSGHRFNSLMVVLEKK